MSDFSIDYILNRAGEKYIGTNGSMAAIQRIQLHAQYPYVFGYNADAVQELMQYQRQQEGERQQQQEPSGFEQLPMFDWLQYTRFHPPKLPRSYRQVPAKRTPGRLPRIPFTPVQLEALERAYKQSNYLSATDANILAECLNLTSTRVKIWFQNRRARDRREKREQEESCDSANSSNAFSPEPDVVILT